MEDDKTINTEWYKDLGLSDESVGVIQSKNWKDADSIIKSYRELEKFSGKDKNDFIEIPKGENPDLSQVYAKLGRPETAEGYELADGDFANAARDVLFKAGITNNQAKALEEWVTQYTKDYQEAADKKAAEELDLRAKASVETLKKSWGADFDKNINLCKVVTKDLGLTDEQIDSMGAIAGADVLGKLLLGIATRTDSEQPLTGYKQGGQETKEMAALRIDELKSDPEFMKRFSSGDEKATQELLRLAAITAQGN